jgi:hypothetical protein
MERTDGPAPTVVPLWRHATTLDARASGRPARAFVRRHLVSHRHFDLLDQVGVVVFRLTNESRSRSDSLLRLEVSRAGDVVLFQVDDTTRLRDGIAVLREGADGALGLGIVELLSRQWGRTSVAGAFIGWWATFDVRRPDRPGGAAAPFSRFTTSAASRSGPSRPFLGGTRADRAAGGPARSLAGGVPTDPDPSGWVGGDRIPHEPERPGGPG